MPAPLLAFLLLCGFAQPALAHHSRAAFALDTTASFEGRLRELGWHNPHAYLMVDVVDDKGEVVPWTFEAHSISGLLRLGWRRDSFEIGERVRVVANPSREPGESFALLSSVTRVSGETFYAFRKPAGARSPQTPLAPSRDFSGTWKPIRELRSALVDGFEPPSDWPYTERARAEIAGFDLNSDPALDCISTGVPRMIHWPYSQRWRWTDGVLEIVTDQSSQVRRARLQQEQTEPARPADQRDSETPERSTTGTSRVRRTSANALTIDSTNFAAERWGNARGVSSSIHKRVREVWTLSPDGYGLAVAYELSDPDYLSEAVNLTARFELVHDYEFNQIPCDPETARRHLQFE